MRDECRIFLTARRPERESDRSREGASVLLDSLHYVRNYRETPTLVRDALVSSTDAVDCNIERYDSHLPSLIAQHIARKCQDKMLNRDVVAEAAGISNSYLSPLIRSHNGMTFHEYLENLRLKEAEKTLLCPSSSVSDISAQVGFASHSCFCRTF